MAIKASMAMSDVRSVCPALCEIIPFVGFANTQWRDEQAFQDPKSRSCAANISMIDLCSGFCGRGTRFEGIVMRKQKGTVAGSLVRRVASELSTGQVGRRSSNCPSECGRAIGFQLSPSANLMGKAQLFDTSTERIVRFCMLTTQRDPVTRLREKQGSPIQLTETLSRSCIRDSYLLVIGVLLAALAITAPTVSCSGTELRFPEGAATASVVSYHEDFDSSRGEEWKTSGCAIGQGLWQRATVLPTGAITPPPAYWYGNQPALDFTPDLPPDQGPCPGLDPPCYRCLAEGYWQPQYATGDLCAFTGGPHGGNLTSPRINLHNVPPPIVLEFKNCLEMESTPSYLGVVVIYARVEIAVNGGEFFTLKSFTTNVSCAAERIDLSDYANSIIQLRWFMAVIGTSSYATNAYGWVVDDVRVIGGLDSSTTNPNPDQRLYVADTGNHRISVWRYKTDSTIVTHFKTFGQCGYDAGQFCSPEDVVVGPNGSAYVADTGNHRIQVFDKDGAYQGQFGSYGVGNDQFNAPSGLAVSGWVLRDNGGGEPDRVADYFYLYVADTLNHRVKRFRIGKNQPTLFTHDGDMGSYGNGDGQFNLPEGIGVDPIDTPAFLAPETYQLPIVPEQWEGHVYVADQSNHRVQYFDLTGAFAGKWGTYGSDNTQLDTPQDVAVGVRLEDPINNVGERVVDVYVADTGNHQVKRYDDVGTYQHTVGGFGDAGGEFESPNGIAVDRRLQQVSVADYPDSVGVDGDAFTVDTGNQRIQSFNRGGTLQNQFGSYGAANTLGTTTILAIAPDPLVFAQAVTLTATVTETALGAAVVTGTVTFRDGGTPIPGGEDLTLDAFGQATFATSSLSAGQHAFTAEYNPTVCTCLDGSTSAQLSGAVSVANGDINGDGAIDLIDARLCLQIARGFLAPTTAQRSAADVDDDGDVDETDAKILCEYIIGMRPTLP